MAETGRKLGKLGLAILENFVESKLGEKFVTELRSATDRQIAITEAMQATADRLWEEWEDKLLWSRIFIRLPKKKELLGELKQAIQTFYGHPTDTGFARILAEILGEYKEYPQELISNVVGGYLTVLTEEMALSDGTFRENVRGLADLRMVEIMRRVEKLLEKQGAPPVAVPADLHNVHQLPSPPADFTGREKEIKQFLQSIQQGATISGLQGLGGVGKTALGLVIAHRLKDEYPDGQIFLDLRGTQGQEAITPAQIMAHVIHSFHPEARLPESEAEILSTYCSVLEKKKVLLFFDNARDRKQVEALLPLPGCLTLVTSRQHFDLPGLKALNLEKFEPKDARKLVRRIANRVKVGEADAIANECDYLPLALRLAASMLNTRPDWTPEVLIDKLRDALALLGPVEASLKWSYDLLDESLQIRFRQLGVFPAPFDKGAASAVWGIDAEAADVALGAFLEASLLEYDRRSWKYDLHDLVRSYAEQELATDVAGENAVHLRHAQHYCSVLGAAEELYLQGGENILRGLQMLDSEWEHIKSGQNWAAQHSTKQKEAMVLCAKYPDAGVYCLIFRLHPRVRISWFEVTLDANRQLDDRRGEGNALRNLGAAYADLGDARKAVEFYEQALVIAREIGDRRGEDAALGNLGLAYADLGDARKAVEFHEQALDIDREIGDRRGEAADLVNLGLAYADLGDARKAIEFYEKALVIDRDLGDRRGEAADLGNLGLAYADLGDVSKAVEFYEKALVINCELGDRRSEGKALGNLGLAYAALGDASKAIEFYEEDLEIAREIGDRRGEGAALGNLGDLLFNMGENQKGIELMKQALSIFEAIDSSNTQWALNKLKDWGEQ